MVKTLSQEPLGIAQLQDVRPQPDRMKRKAEMMILWWHMDSYGICRELEADQRAELRELFELKLELH